MTSTIGAPEALAGIRTIHHGAPPVFVGKIPFDCLAQTTPEIFVRPPAERAFELARVDRIAQIMSGPVGDKRDQISVPEAIAARTQFIKDGADRPHHIDVTTFLVAADNRRVNGQCIDITGGAA